MKDVQIDVREVGLYIDGEYVKSSNQATFEVKTPATQEVFARVSAATAADVDKACQTARQQIILNSLLTLWKNRVEKSIQWKRSI
jgi:aminomuconate-semialdehyde/2-hydroxymuconate-6-semialdehyde dehydrogenase